LDPTEPSKGNPDLVEMAWDGGLIRSTSQTVFDVLTAITNTPSAYKNRWLWELFQNAIDASDGKPIQIKIRLDEDKLVFSHTGTPFTVEEAVQLILKGSTKRMLSGKLGRFGTGFIATHFISKIVDVAGVLEEAPGFKFELNRDAPSAVQLGIQMAKAKEDLKNSMASYRFEGSPYTTTFSYHLVNQESKTLAKESLDAIGAFLPYVLALNPEIDQVTIEGGGSSGKWQRDLGEKISSDTTLVKVSTGSQDDSLWVAVKEVDGVSVSIGLKEYEGGFALNDLSTIPKLFAAFPLVGTESFPTPAILNSRGFEPTDDRNGVWLGDPRSPEVQKNRPLAKQGIELVASLAKVACDESWRDLHMLTHVPATARFDWADQKWLNAEVKGLVEVLRKLPLLESELGTYVAPTNSKIPFSEEEDTRSRIWEVVSKLYPGVIPRKNLGETWSTTIKNWSSILGIDPTSMSECFTLSKLAENFESITNVDRLSSLLPPSENSTTVMNSMLKLAFDKDKGLFDSHALVPNQKGVFCKRGNFRKDLGIEEDLKSIAAKFGIDIKARLASLSVLTEVQELGNSFTDDDVVNEIKPILNNPSKPLSQNYKESNPEFLDWAIRKQRYGMLDGFPVITIEWETTAESDLVTFSSKEPILAPPTQWDSRYSKFSSLFPPEGVMSSVYDSAVSKESWAELSKRNFVLSAPLYTVSFNLDKGALEALLAGGEFDAGKEHRATVAVSTLAFLSSESGVMDIVRSSQERAVEFLDFLLNVLISIDNSWKEPVECKCDCQSLHKIYPSMWLYAVRTRVWVPFPSKARRQADAESMARMFEARTDLQPKLLDDLTAVFFGRLKISITDILKNIGTKDEQAKIALEKALVGVFLASGKSVDELNMLAEVWRNPEYKAQIEKMVQQRELVQKNQEIGRTVEQLIQAICKDAGIELKKIHRGGDFVNENDFTDPEGQVVLKAGNLTIEVKATVTNSAKMTPAQAEESVTQGQNYFLCVVQLSSPQINLETVRKDARFVPRIGEKLKHLVDAYHSVQTEESKALSSTGDVQLSIEGTLVRFQINKQAWKEALTLDDFKEVITKTLVLPESSA
jgi:hypothetical protein